MTVEDLFRNVVVIDYEGKASTVPFSAQLDENKEVTYEVEMDNVSTPSLLLASLDSETYKLYAWTSLQEDMNMIVEQVILKFSPLGVNEETRIKLVSMTNNMEAGQDPVIYEYVFKLAFESKVSTA